MTKRPRVLDGRYQCDVKLGTGGQGRVFRGRDLVTQRPVAIKLMDQGKDDDPEFVAKFVQEGRLAARIRDPHLVAALHFGVAEDGQRYIVYDYIPGVVPLTTLLDDKRMAPARVCDIALQLLDTLETLHAAGVVHQDLSPANILWCPRPSGRIEVFLIDLGSASSTISGGLRPAREPVGADYFMAPEMVRDGGVCDHRVDLWSVGAIMFTLLTGCFIDLGTDEEPLEPPPPASIVPSIPQAVSDVVMGALTHVDRRYPSASAMRAAIQRLELPSLPRPLPPPAPPRPPVWSRLGGPVAVALLAVLGTLAVERLLGHPPTSTIIAQESSTPIDTSLEAAVPGGGAVDKPISAEDPPARSAPGGEAKPPTEDPSVQIALGGEANSAAPPPADEPASPPKKPRPVTWSAVERAIKKRAGALGPCVSGAYVSLGVQVAQGEVTLTSVNGKPLSLELPHHQCVHRVVARLRFAPGTALGGVVGVPLAGDSTRTG